MPIRTRTMAAMDTVGSLTKFGVTSYCTNEGSYSTCVDDTSRGDGLYFSVESMEVSGGCYSGKQSNSRYFSNWRATAMEPLGQYTHATLPSSKPGYVTVATEVLKATNPSRPSVNLPVSIAELKDLPSMLRGRGVSILKDWKRRLKSSSAKDKARLHLEFQFGWAPIIDDLRKLIEFQKSVDKRIKELEKLKEKGLRRKIVVYSDCADRVGGVKTLESNAFGLSGYLKTITSCEISGFVVWKPSGSFPKTNDDIRRLAERAILGASINPSVAWNLVPWSWLIDWFSNVGDWLDSHSSIVPCTHSTVQVMESNVSEFNWVITSQSSYAKTGEPFSLTKTSLRRQPTSALLTASMPALSGGQASILASLGILRR